MQHLYYFLLSKMEAEIPLNLNEIKHLLECLIDNLHSDLEIINEENKQEVFLCINKEINTFKKDLNLNKKQHNS